MNIGKRIKLARKDRGLSQPALAQLCGWQSQSRISHYETGAREPSYTDAEKIAVALSVPTEWLLAGGGLLDSGVVPRSRRTPHRGMLNQPPSSNFMSFVATPPPPKIQRKVPLISWTTAGDWGEVVDRFIPNDAEDWVVTTAKVDDKAFALHIHGDSMEPAIPNGSIIIVDPNRDPKNNSIVVVRQNHNTEATCKRLVIDGGRKYLQPDNQRYPIMEMLTDAVIVGVVRQVIRDLE